MDKISNVIKNVIMPIIKKFVKFFVFHLIVPIFIVIFVIALLWYIVDKGIVQNITELIVGDGANSHYIKTIVDDNNRVYKVDENLLSNINSKIDNNSVSRDNLGLDDKLLQEFIKADVITTLPDLRRKNEIWLPYDGDDVQGCIKFVRRYEDGSSETMEYVPFNTFQQMLAKFGYNGLKDSEGNSVEINQDNVYKTKDEVLANYNVLRGYFTLDEEKRLIISKISTTETKKEYNSYAKEEGCSDSEDFDYYVSIEKIDYQLELSKKAYSMPVEFLISILATSENSGFVKEVAKLGNDSKIEISIYDYNTEIESVTKEDFYSEFYMKKSVDYSYEVEVETTEENKEETTKEDKENKGNKKENSSDSTKTSKVTQTVSKKEEQKLDDNKQAIVPPENEPETTPETKEEEPKKEVLNDSKSVYGYVKKGINLTGDNAYCKTIRTTNETSNSLCVTMAKTWVMDVTADVILSTDSKVTTEGEEKSEAGTSQIPSSEISDLSGYASVSDYHHLLNYISITDIPENAQIKNSSEEIYEKRGESEYFTSIITKSKALNIVSNIELKEEKFLSLLKVNPNVNPEVFDKVNRNLNTKVLEYENQTGYKFEPEDTLLNGALALFDYLHTSVRTQSYEEIMRYLFYVYTGIDYGYTTLSFDEYSPTEFTGVQSTVYAGSSFEYKIWITLKNAGYSDIAIAGALGNFKQECNFKAYCEERYDGNSSQKELCEKYIADVDSGVITKDEFINSRTGFGLVQWTYHSRKAAFYDFVKSVNGSIGDEALQIEFLMAELGNPISGSSASNFTGACIMENNSFTDSYDGMHYGPHTLSDWTNAQTPEDAAEAFDCVYESGTGVELRKRYARELYEKYQNMSTGGMILERMGENGKSKEGLIIARYQAPNGKIFTTFNQGGGSGGIGGIFQTGCNRAAQISVCSAYYYEQGKDDAYIIQRGKDAPNNTCPGWRTMYDECGLEAWTTWENNSMSPQITPEQIKEVLVKGGYLVFCVKGNKSAFGTADSSSKVLSKYGHAWAGTQHYIAILSYRIGENGEEIYVSSSSRCDHKDESTIMTGWHPLDEFSYATYKGSEVPNYIKSVTEIYEKSQNATPVYVKSSGKV